MVARSQAAARLARLAEKYRLLARLQAGREALEAKGRRRFAPRQARARRTIFQRLAREFPGALRELDATPAEVLRARLAAVLETQKALEGGLREDLPLWMEIASAYHRQLRESLAIKGWLARRLPRGGSIDPATWRAFQRWYRALDVRLTRADAMTRARLSRHLVPPGGRLQSVVWEALERRFARPRREMERLLFGDLVLERARESDSAAPISDRAR